MKIRPTTGLQIDGFTLGEKLHEGGFATIWAVTHPEHPGAMVMKVPKIMDGYDGPTIVGFEVEQMIQPRLSGPHVPKTHGIGDFSVLPYIVTECIPGDNLLIRFRKAPFAVSEVIEMAARLADALHDLHSQHVIHLDLKPENVLQRPGGEMVLVDYGLSRHDGLPDLLAEEFTIPMGTFPYIAPEQYLGARNDPRSDIFALGAMVYQAATGKLPFGKPETLRGVRPRLWRDPVPPRAHVPEMPEWLQEIILRALEVDPAKRYQTAAQMAFDLTHPGQVKVTERGLKTTQDSRGTVWRRWWKMRKIKGFAAPASVLSQIAKAPILLVAVDLSPEMEGLADRLRDTLARMLVTEPDTRVACVNVIKTSRIALDATVDDEGRNLHVSRLLGLRAWAEGIDLGEERLTFSVLENTDPAAAILDYARHNNVDHILMGARGHSTTRRFLGSVSAQVVAEAHCSVTVIRRREALEAEPQA